MGTVTVDLPAHNVWVDDGVGGVDPASGFGGHESLADNDDTSGVSLSAATGGFHVGATSPGSGGGFSVGFGLIDLPGGATLIDARFVARMDVSSVGVVPPGSYDTNPIDPVPVRYPTLGIEYAAPGTLKRYSLDAPTSGTGHVEVVGSPIAHFIAGSDYVVAGIGTPDTGTFGLCPYVYIADPWWQVPPVDNRVFVSYLAIRVTYTTVGAPPLRRYPPNGNGGHGPTRHYPPRTNRRTPGSF